MFELKFSNIKEHAISLPLQDAEITYYPNFLSGRDADVLFAQLYKATPWQEDRIKIFGKEYLQPRLTALYGENGKSYSYSGITMHPLPFTKELQNLKNKIEVEISEKFTTALLNLYRDGKDSNGWHSDNEKELGTKPVIASLSLGAERYFHLKHKTEQKERYKILLNHGSLLLMKGDTQDCWLHQIPKTKKVVSPRINITFRFIP